jgi:hypothetical protein
MPALFDRKAFPDHVFLNSALDFSDDLLVNPLQDLWFRLGSHRLTRNRDASNVEEEVFRQSILIPPRSFPMLFPRLESIGNILRNPGAPGGVLSQRGNQKKYSYCAFHQFRIGSVLTEPLVFLHEDSSHADFFINPDLWMSLGLEERAPGSGIWWAPKKGVDALRLQTIDNGQLKIVEIRTDYLLRYLQARQLALLVGHYRQLLLFHPSQDATDAFVKEDLTVGSEKQGVKAILQNWGLRNDLTGNKKFLQRRLHLWFRIKPPKLDIDDPWSEPLPFDPYAFLLPTEAGLVAPARWAAIRYRRGAAFQGATCDFMDRIYFRQEVLSKYEGTTGFSIRDDGSVSCQYWGLRRSTARIGNELLSTAIGDFAEGVPMSEWPHWKQFAVEPPGRETVQALLTEEEISEAVNAIANALTGLNATFVQVARMIGVRTPEPLWNGALDSLAGRQLKWVYPATAADDEFLKRATLLSTLVIDGLVPAALRAFLQYLGPDLHQSYEKGSRTLGSRLLLQRLTLIAVLITRLQPTDAELSALVRQAEGKASAQANDLQQELESLYQQVRRESAPLAFLYDLRIHGGLAHPPNAAAAGEAAAKLGLPRSRWHRRDYLGLLVLARDSIHHIDEHLSSAIIALEERV